MLTLEAQLSPGVGAGRQARAFVHDILQASDLAQVNDVVQLLSSELVNNVVEHASGSPTIRITPDGEKVRVEVDDPSTDAPVLEVPDVRSEHGRGLLLVATFASDWGFVVGSRGKTVWFEVAAPRGRGN